MSVVFEVNDIDALANYGPAWNRLLAQTPRASFFQSFDWLRVYWRHFGHGQTLRVLIVRAGAEIVGIVPLVVCAEKTRVGRMRLLTYPLHDWGTFYGPIGPNSTAVLFAAMRHLRSTPRAWDMLDLRWLDRGHVDGGATGRAMRAANFAVDERAWQQAATVDLSLGWDAYWSSRDARWRSNVRRYEKRLSELGPVHLERFRPRGLACDDGDARSDLYDQCEALSRRSWQGNSTIGTTLCHESIRPFLREAHTAAAQAGCVDLNLLYAGGQPVAFAYNYCYRGHVSGLRMGYLPEVAGASAGAVLMTRVIEDSFRRGDTLFDLGVGYLDGKRYLQTAIETTWRCTYYPPTVARAQLLRLKRWAVRRRTPAAAPKRSAPAKDVLPASACA